MKVAILRYNAGNIYSVVHALKRLGVEAVLTDDAAEIRSADRVVFPGQGEAATTMAALRANGLDKLIPTLRQPVLGICIGMQLMCARSEEGDTPCLGIFPDVSVRRFAPRTAEDKVPHMGWNTLQAPADSLFRGVDEGAFVYYIHSFYVPQCDFTIATTEYCGTSYSAALRRGNFRAVQFHPEKSGSVGETILRNFLDDTPDPTHYI